jgi:O-antigen/teichoic acid export membrane protein
MVGVFGAILNLTLILIALFGGFGVIGVLLGLWISSVSSGIVVVILSYKWEIVGRKSYIFSPLIWKQLVSYGLKVHLGTLLQSLNYRFDMYLVAFFLGTASVGLYSVAVGMAEWLWLLPGVLGTVLMQRVATQSEEEANVMMGPLNRLTSGVLVIGTLVWAVFGVWIIRILYGEAFAPSYYPLLLLLPGIWALGLWKNIMNDLAVRGYPATKSYTAGASAVVTLALDIVLIPRWGIAGAAIASSIAYWTAFCFALWYYCRVTPFRAREVFSPTLKDLSLAFGRMRRGIQEIVAKSL